MGTPSELQYRSSSGDDTTSPAVCPAASYANYQIQSHQVILRSNGDSSEVLTNAPHNDGHIWRKYGEKKITGFAFRRNYYRCTYKEDQGCPAIKQVQQQQNYFNNNQTPTYLVVYKKNHTCHSTASATTYRIKEGLLQQEKINIDQATRPFSLDHFSTAVQLDDEHDLANLWSVNSSDIKSSSTTEAEQYSSAGEVNFTSSPNYLLREKYCCSKCFATTSTYSTAACSDIAAMQSSESSMEKTSDDQMISSMTDQLDPFELTNSWSTSFEDIVDARSSLWW